MGEVRDNLPGIEAFDEVGWWRAETWHCVRQCTDIFPAHTWPMCAIAREAGGGAKQWWWGEKERWAVFEFDPRVGS